jgi:CIC family chloride channel protein
MTPAHETRQSIGQTMQYLGVILITSGLIGLLVSMVCSLFVRAVQHLGAVRTSFESGFLTLPGTGLSVAPLLWLAAAVVGLAVIKRVFSIDRWHGPADSIYAAHRTDNELDIKAGIGSTVAAFISLGGGAPVGQYGPLVHFGASLGSWFCSIFSASRMTVDVFIGCGVAAAIAAGFHAPIAGIVFAHEAVLRHFSFRAITPIAIASITSAWLSSRVFGGAPVLQVDFTVPDLLPMVPALLVSGLFFGVVAICFMKMLFAMNRLAASSGLSSFALGMVAALLIGCAGMLVPEIMGLGTTTVLTVLDNGYLIGFLLLLLLLKIVVTSLSIGFGLFGGAFSPALFIGAAAGGFTGKIFALVGLASAPQLLAVAGMAAVAATVVGAPISVVLIVLELTTSYDFAVAAMLSVVMATLFSSLVFGHSFFDAQLAGRGIDLSQGRGNLELMKQTIDQVIQPDFVRLSADMTVKSAIAALAKAGVSEGYSLDEKGRFFGKAVLQTLIGKKPGDRLGQHLDGDPIKLNHDASIMQAMEVASNFVGETIPVIRDTDGYLAGVVSEADIFQGYLATQNRIHDLEHG